MAELSLRDLGSCARLEENCGVHVPEGVEARPGNFQCIAQRPESLLNSFAGRSVQKEKPLVTVANRFPQHTRKILRNRNCTFAPYGLRRLNLTVPRGLSDVQDD